MDSRIRETEIKFPHDISLTVADFVAALSAMDDVDKSDDIERLRRMHLRRSQVGPNKLAKAAILNLLSDLARQGWKFEFGAGLYLQSPELGGRDSRRAQLIAQRTEQLRSPTVQAFIRKMERVRWFGGKRVSVFSLMRDGRDLSASLERVVAQGAPLNSAIKPYLQFVDDAECRFTGIPLADLWRYFRYTWTNPLQSVPGRSMMFLVRDAAAPFHPVMGIGALSSAAVKLRGRDEFIGWEPDSVIDTLLRAPETGSLQWLESLLDSRLDEIFKGDLIEDGILPAKLDSPSEDLIAKLQVEAAIRRAQHHGTMDAQEYKRSFSSARAEGADEQEYWEKRSRTPLFRSKRAEEIANLLVARKIMRSCSSGSSQERMDSLLSSKDGRQSIANLVRLAKATRVGTAIADLTTCGAVPPYNSLLVGKLVALLAVSPEVVREIRSRYGTAPSVIASSMAGRAITRPSCLVFIGTTSLYGERPCQYDRISIPADFLGGIRGESIKYRFISDTMGWGTFQFSEITTRSILGYVRAEKNGQRVNYVFGEGANPKMRALREGLAALGFDEDRLLKHGQRRSMYGVSLVSNLSSYLLGRDPRPQYLFDLKNPEQSTQRIVDWWAVRWLKKRLERPDVLEEVRRHTLVHPITHGARVQLPESDPEQFSLIPYS